jgi:predicted amidohydrolase YtcJ
VKTGKNRVTLLSLLLIVAGPLAVIPSPEAPDWILCGAKILTAGSSTPVRADLAVRDGRILEIGAADVIKRLADARTRRIDAGGCTVVAGLHDAHVHFESGAKMLTQRMSLRFMNLEEILARVKAAVAASPPGALILGYHFNQAYFLNGAWPTRHDLDAVAPQNPVVISRVDGHSVWVNSKALEMADITKETPDPQGGEIQRDAAGNPTGILKEKAENLVAGIQAPEMVVPGQSSADPLLAAIRHANQLGLTSVTTSGSLELVERLRGLQERDLLTLRFHVWLDGEELAAHLEKGARFNQGDEFVRIAFLKLFVDGTIGSATAAMFAPYRHQPGSSGILIHPVETFNRLVAAAHAQDWAVGVHAIGNRGVHLVLNAVEAAQKQYGVKGLRHRIEHSQFVRDEDLARYARLGVVASMQPTHCTTDLLVVEDRIGRERARQGYRWRSFLRSGAMLAFGTDWPIEPLDPRRGLYSAVERRNIENGEPAAGWFQEEAITLAEALDAYARGSAVAVHREKDLGRLEKGCLADLTVFAGDIFEIARKDPRGLLDVPVELTVVHGRIVHQRNQKKPRDSENL